MKITTTLFVLFLSTTFAFSQRQETIDSDRPGQSISPLTVGANVLQVQTGFNYFNRPYYNALTIHSISNATNVRFGITETFELNSTFGYRRNENIYADPRRENLISSGFENLRLGARFNILNKGGLTPTIAINTEFLFALENEVSFFPNDGLEIKASIKQPLTEKLALTTNLSLFHNPYIPDYFYQYTLNSSYSFTDEIFAFVEIYGLLNYGKTINYDGGVGYYLNNDLLLDISAGLVPNGDQNDWFIDAGVSFRLGGGAAVE